MYFNVAQAILISASNNGYWLRLRDVMRFQPAAQSYKIRWYCTGFLIINHLKEDTPQLAAACSHCTVVHLPDCQVLPERMYTTVDSKIQSVRSGKVGRVSTSKSYLNEYTPLLVATYGLCLVVKWQSVKSYLKEPTPLLVATFGRCIVVKLAD